MIQQPRVVLRFRTGDVRGFPWPAGPWRVRAPALPFPIKFFECGTAGVDLGFLVPEAFVFFADFHVQSFDFLPIRDQPVAFIAEPFSFDGERFLPFEEFDPVAAHDFHLLCELVFPGRHLLELSFKNLRGIENGVLGGFGESLGTCVRDANEIVRGGGAGVVGGGRGERYPCFRR